MRARPWGHESFQAVKAQESVGVLDRCLQQILFHVCVAQLFIKGKKVKLC